MTRILVVEDSPTQAAHVCQTLEAEGIEVAWAADAAAALQAMPGGRFDLVLTDVTMPGVLDGVGLLRALRADPATATLPVVVLSARAEEEARVGGLAAGADDYVVKPFAPRELLARIEGAIRLSRLRHEVASREQELEIARGEVKLALALEAAKMGKVIYDPRTGAIAHTPGFPALLGLPGDRPLSLPDILQRQHPECGEGLLPLDPPRSPEGEFDIERRVVWPDGSERWLAGRGRLACDAAGAPTELIAVYMDVTERRAGQLRLEQLQAELAQAGRLSELGRMSSAIAHELKQPLAAANSYLSTGRRLALKATPDLERLNAVLEKAASQVTQAGEILKRLGGFVGKGEAVRAPADLRSLVEEAVEIARLDPRSRAVQLRVDTPEALQVVADRVQIQQVLLNLLRNAFEAVEHCPTKMVEVAASVDQDTVEVRVSDSGPGLSPQVMSSLFQPFVTTKADGMGVGLSICREIVEAHGGRMWAEATGGPGAVFRLRLPANG